MPSRAIKPKREDDSRSGGWQGLRERAPSLVRPEEPTTGRVLALIALFPLTLGAASLFFALIKRGYLITPGWGVLLLLLGIGGLLYHAFNERDQQYRRLYWVIGLALFAVGILCRLLPSDEAGLGGETFLPYGAPALLLALGFLTATARHETDPVYRRLTLNGLAAAGVGCAALGAVGGIFSESFLLGQGLVLLLLGLLYLAAYVGLQEPDSDRAYLTGLGIGLLGGLLILTALGFSLLPPLLFQWGWLESAPANFFMPRGLLLLYAGLEYVLLAVGICSDNKLVVLTRRELAAFFYSPVAYIVLIGSSLIGWLSFTTFLGLAMEPRIATADNIFFLYVATVIPVFAVVLIVPLLTMRLLSEERRTGSLEVLLTAPVNETSVVLSKFFAALRLFLLAWYPWGLFLLALRLETSEWFDYRPVLAFAVALVAMASGWLAMGLFFSSLTRNQIAAAAMTLVGMIALVAVVIVNQNIPVGSAWHDILHHISFVDLWWSSARGRLAPRDLVFHLTAAVFWLFLTVKVLEARKWT